MLARDFKGFEVWTKYTLTKIYMEPENDDLEDYFPFPQGVFSGSMLIFRGVSRWSFQPFEKIFI